MMTMKIILITMIQQFVIVTRPVLATEIARIIIIAVVIRKILAVKLRTTALRSIVEMIFRMSSDPNHCSHADANHKSNNDKHINGNNDNNNTRNSSTNGSDAKAPVQMV